MEPKELTSTLAYILAGVLLAFLINSGMGLALGTDLPIVAVQSNSMVPTFYKGDLLLLRGVQAGDLQVGDIIVFSTDERSTPIVHRLVEINPDGTFQTKGDANTNQHPFETKIPYERIHGVVMFIIPYLGWVKIGLSDYAIPLFISNLAWVIFFSIVIIIAYYKFWRTE
jgi:signal peptidase